METFDTDSTFITIPNDNATNMSGARRRSVEDVHVLASEAQCRGRALRRAFYLSVLFSYQSSHHHVLFVLLLWYTF